MTMFDSRLLPLLHLCDSLFPTGGFSHSDGLESATSAGLVATSSDLREWMEVCLEENLGRCEGPAVYLALQARSNDAWEVLHALDEEVCALRPSSTARAASRAMGTRLLKTWNEIRAEAPHTPGTLDTPELKVEPTYCADRQFSFPVAFGMVCASIGVEARTAVAAFIYTRLASITSSAMRLMRIGQRDAHALLASMLERVPASVAAIADRCERGERP